MSPKTLQNAGIAKNFRRTFDLQSYRASAAGKTTVHRLFFPGPGVETAIRAKPKAGSVVGFTCLLTAHATVLLRTAHLHHL